jgi:hypothetical protein
MVADQKIWSDLIWRFEHRLSGQPNRFPPLTSGKMHVISETGHYLVESTLSCPRNSQQGVRQLIL